MEGSQQASLTSWIEGLGAEKEQIHSVGDQILRLNLKPDDLQLWRDTFSAMAKPGNVLLACESDMARQMRKHWKDDIVEAFAEYMVEGAHSLVTKLWATGDDGRILGAAEAEATRQTLAEQEAKLRETREEVVAKAREAEE